MQEEAPQLIVYLDTKRPIDIDNFISEFVGLKNQYEKFLRQAYPDIALETKFFVKEVHSGSIEVILVSLLATGYSEMVSAASHYAVEKFVTSIKEKITRYIHGKRVEDASKSDLADFNKTVAAIANDPDGKGRIQAAYFEDGERKIREAFVFDTSEARAAEREIAQHRLELEKKTADSHERVLMRFVRSSIQAAKTGKRTGELAIIDAISDRALPIVYASELAEQRIKHEVKEADENVFKKAFEVAVSVELVNGKPAAYRVTDVYQVIDLPDDLFDVA
jgi:hypothetical protein